jgi:hypothetical protein
MINEQMIAESPALLKVIDYADPSVEQAMTSGRMNTDEATLREQIRASIRRGYPQMRQGPVRPERVCLVGSGPSLNDPETLQELRDLVWEGAILITMNGSYHWCIERNLRPQTQILMDARPVNARFLHPAVPKCNYVLASQCAPAAWDMVAGREHVWIFHPVVKSEPIAQELDSYYGGQWMGVGGGTTVASRALNLLRQCGYVRFDLFGIDCCWQGDHHHAMAQPENANDRKTRVTAGERGRPETMRTFEVSAWMLKQFEDLMTQCQPAINGKHWLLQVHGDGLFAHVMRVLGTGLEVDMRECDGT